MILHSSQYSKIKYFPQLGLIKHVWFSASKNMLEDDFVAEMKVMAKIIDHYKPRYMIVDHRNFFFVVVPSLHQWLDETIHRRLFENKCEKLAFLVSPDLLTRLSVSLVNEEQYSRLLEVRFFENYDELCEWLDVDKHVLELTE